MKCLSPISISNPRYKLLPFNPTRLVDGEHVEKLDDSKLLVPCGKCYHCLKNKRNALCFRLTQEYLHSDKAYFITLTVNDQYMPLFKKDPKKIFRTWFEELRYKTGHSPRHYIISELGHLNHRLHFHGIIFNPLFDAKELSVLWKYGFSYVGYCNQATINYIAKYITKPQLDDPDYKPLVFQSNRPGIGHQWLTESNIQNIRRSEDYSVYCGKVKIALPRYYFDKVFSEEEKSKKIADYHRTLLENPFEYVFKTFLRNGVSSINEYLNKVQIHYQITLDLKQSKPIYKPKTILENGFIVTDYDSSTSERV